MSEPGKPAVLKPLLPFRGSTLVETAVAAALGAGCRVFVVVGNGAAEVASRFDTRAYASARGDGLLGIVENRRWEEGMLGSIQAALPAVSGAAFFVAHADMPFVAADDYRAIEAAFAAASRESAEHEAASRDAAGLAAVFASHNGARGHPVLIPSAWIPGILALEPGLSLRDFLRGKPQLFVETGEGALRDIDTPEDYCLALSPDI